MNITAIGNSFSCPLWSALCCCELALSGQVAHRWPSEWEQASYGLTSAPAHKIAIKQLGLSALGHKRTFALHQPMSALPPNSGHSLVHCVGVTLGSAPQWVGRESKGS